MPELRWFWMTSLPETAAKAAKQLWKSKPGMDLRITKPRKPEWLAQNLDNPFRGWDGAEHIPAAAAKKAAGQMCIRDRFRKATQREPLYQCIFHEDDGSLTESYCLMFE